MFLFTLYGARFPKYKCFSRNNEDGICDGVQKKLFL